MPPPDLSSRIDNLPPQSHARAVFIPTNVASRKIRAALDRLAVGVVWIGGIATIISILGIFVYLLIEVAPLFIAPEGKEEANFQSKRIKEIVTAKPTAFGGRRG